MAIAYTQITDRCHEGNEFHQFDANDAKGRIVGCRIQREVLVYDYNTPDQNYGYSQPAGTYFCWMGRATRSGKDFGAIQPNHHCATEQEREEQIEKYLANAQKRSTSK